MNVVHSWADYTKVMQNKTLATLLLFSALLINLINNPAHAVTITLPPTLLSELKTATEQRDKGECEQKNRELFSTDFYALNDKLLILVGLPDYFCHASSVMPVTVDTSGHWQTGTVIESYPSLLLQDDAQHLWLVSHWEHEAVFPLLHHSVDGVHWQEIHLPKLRIECCFVWLKQLCIAESKIQLKFTGMDNAPVEYWQTTVNDSLHATPKWQQHTQVLKNCQTQPLTHGDWQRNAAKEEVLFHSAARAMTVILPKWLF